MGAGKLPLLAQVIFAKAYHQKLIGIFGRSSITALWGLLETAGTTAYDLVSGRNGAYSGVALANTTGPRGRPAPLWDGVNDTCNVYSAALASAFSPGSGTLLIWCKVYNVGVWSDSTNDFAFQVGADNTSNYVRIIKTSTASRMQGSHVAGGTAKSVSTDVSSNPNWFLYAITWDKEVDQVKVYYNGVQSGATQTGLGIWSGSLGSNSCAIGAQSGGGSQPWNGWLAYALLLNRAASAVEISKAYA